MNLFVNIATDAVLPELITPPLTILPTTSTAFENLDDVKIARRELQMLGAGAKNAEQASKRCQRTLFDVQKLLEAENLTQFRFRHTKRIPAANGAAHQKSFQSPQLSSFAQIVFDNTAVQYLPPESPNSKIKHETNSQASPIDRRPAKPPSHNLQPEQQYNGYTGYTNREQPSAPPSHHARPHAVILSTALTPAQRAEYQYISDVPSTEAAPQLTPSRTQGAQLTGRSRVTIDQREKSDAALESLNNQLSAIFEAEDQIQLDHSGDTSQSAALFTTFEIKDGSVSVLQPEAQLQLDKGLRKVGYYQRLDSIPVEHLTRVQGLCERTIAIVPSDSLQIGEDWSDNDITEWLGRVGNTENALVAAQILMRIMSACPHQKELQSEDYLRQILDAMQTTIESCVVSLVEERSTLGEKIRGEKEAPLNAKFHIALENRKPLQSLLQTATNCLKLLGDILSKTDIDESAISSVEYLCKMLLFTENAGSEKDSALGVQTFETMRRTAMDLLTKVFTKYTGQRQFIFQEILLSLEKLPATKQSARQFRLIDAKPIQLVSALLMRLVQTSATASGISIETNGKAEEDENNEESESDNSEDGDYNNDRNTTALSSGKKHPSSKQRKKQDELTALTKPLHDATRQNANYIVSMLIQRAVTTSKSSEEPFRKLLDIFTEDFLNVLGSSDWPSAEILLRTLVLHMIKIIENPKSPAPARALGLELLGTIGSGILDVQSTTRDAARTLDLDDPVSQRLVAMAEHLEAHDVKNGAVLAFDGPYRVVVEYLLARDNSDAQLRTASGYHLMQWASSLSDTRDASAEDDESNGDVHAKELKQKVINIMQDQQWLEEHSDFPTPSTGQGRLAARIVASNSTLCRAFGRIFNIILSAMTSEQPTIRSRSLKSVTTLLENDPGVLDRHAQVLNQIVRCLNDPSSLVRDSALTLVEKCISLRPELDLKVYDRVLPRTTDAAAGVRKRSMRFLKQVYLRNDDNGVRSAIANAVISRIQDTDESVAEIARLTIEEIWFSSFQNFKSETDRSVELMLQFRSQAALIIQTVTLAETVAQVLETLLRTFLNSSKQAVENTRICKEFVNVLFDGVIDNYDIPGAPSQSSILQALTVFAKAGPTLFTGDQLERLEPYTENLKSSDDLDVFHYAITILSYTMPQLTAMKHDFLQRLQTSLLSSVAKLPKSELSVVAPCLWTIDSVLGNTDRLVKFVNSAVQGVNSMRNDDLSTNAQKAARVTKLLTIIGQFGKACDFEQHLATFKASHPAYKGNSVAALIVEVLCQFTSPTQPLSIREASLEAVCAVCQSRPKQFLRADVNNALELVFKNKIPSLERVLLQSLEVFFCAQEAPSEDQDSLEAGSGVATGSQRLGGTYVATDQDGASASISQRFLPEFVRIALASYDDVALLAARIVVSINRQGMAHPRESGPSLVALETCPNAAIAKMAFLEHKQMYSKHESVFEKELVRAIQQAFDYQQQVVGSTTGFTGQPPVSKFHFLWDVLRSGKGKVRQKFFTGLCSKLDFDSAKLDIAASTPAHLLFVRFCTETVAYLDYDRVDDLQHLLSCLEKNFHGTGAVVAQAIETEILKLQVEMAAPSSDTWGSAGNTYSNNVTPIDPQRLRQLAISSQILSLQWETRSFLRRLWNMHRFSGKPKPGAKEASRAPTRASNASSLIEAFQHRVNDLLRIVDTEETQRSTCHAFVELFSVDNEVKVASDEDEQAMMMMMMDNGIDTRSDSGGSAKSPSVPPGAIGLGKKRKSLSAANSPRKKGKPRKSSSFRLIDDEDEDGGWD